MSENRQTSIRADEWHKVADAVKRGECEVWAGENDKVIHVRQSMPSGRLIATLYESLDGTKSQNIVFNTDTFTVRWNDTPPASESAVDADAEVLQWLKRQPKGKLMSMSLEHLASLALEGDKASEPVDAGEVFDLHDLKMWALDNVSDNRVLASLDHLVEWSGELLSKVANAERQLDREKSRVRVAQDGRDNETERYRQAHENFVKVVRLINRYAVNDHELHAAFEALLPTLHQSINEHDKVQARVSMLASENEALKTVNGRLERQLAAAGEFKIGNWTDPFEFAFYWLANADPTNSLNDSNKSAWLDYRREFMNWYSENHKRLSATPPPAPDVDTVLQQRSDQEYTSTLYNIRDYVTGTGQFFPARNKTAVLSQLDRLIIGEVKPPAPVSPDRALVEACKPFVALWRKWVVYSTDENCADSELSFWQWFLQGSTNPDIKAEHIRKLAAAAALAEQGGEGENS